MYKNWRICLQRYLRQTTEIDRLWGRPQTQYIRKCKEPQRWLTFIAYKCVILYTFILCKDQVNTPKKKALTHSEDKQIRTSTKTMFSLNIKLLNTPARWSLAAQFLWHCLGTQNWPEKSASGIKKKNYHLNFLQLCHFLVNQLRWNPILCNGLFWECIKVK